MSSSMRSPVIGRRRGGDGALRGRRIAVPLYHCRYFELLDGVDHLDGGSENPLNPRGELGYMASTPSGATTGRMR